ncbi:uncharacterized protein LOC127751238 [Frankliniella occidentalis]|uniref:Uncharacterized protein LOC127751238 n=1 Tax=Frankliniella occidentalis TaxID=133901 RepID=A0A9C6XT74_FRAOC|nr:uncharacterized protein LOC127751238 [Frankliniella occidentalis]
MAGHKLRVMETGFFALLQKLEARPDWQENHDWYKNVREDNITPQTLENADIKLTPFEIAYNKCVFQSQNNGTPYNKFLGTADLACGSSGELCNEYFAPQETPQSFLMSAQHTETLKENLNQNEQKKGRALIKTRDAGFMDFPGSGSEPEVVSGNCLYLFDPQMDQGRNTSPDLTYSHNCRRPNVRNINGRDKSLKAIIGRQEKAIRDLHAKLSDALQVIKQANLMNPELMRDLSGGEKTGEAEASSINRDTSVFDLVDIKKVLLASCLTVQTFNGVF